MSVKDVKSLGSSNDCSAQEVIEWLTDWFLDFLIMLKLPLITFFFFSQFIYLFNLLEQNLTVNNILESENFSFDPPFGFRAYYKYYPLVSPLKIILQL